MEQMCENFEICPLPNKVEIFRNALEKTLGEDLQKVLWVKSQNSEVWLDRRTNYTRSLAVMSMVGYILGLGDRHPSNIMLERHTGKIVHIDFGDCFEIAMRREKFPEKIPFRLTRMLIKAMEVSGIEGNFRTTCENTMRVMRESKESLLAIMEAFVYDPLISFRLLNPKMFKKHKEDEEVKQENKADLDKLKIEPQPISENHDASEIVAMIDENI
jgi:FKBP12-rapamycin complex-associated protein